MACEENKGCSNSLVKKVLLSYDNFIEFLKGVSGKIYVIWGNLKLDIQKPLHLEKTSGGTTIELKGYIDEASKDEEGNYTSGIMSATDKEKLDSIPEDIPIYNIVKGNGLTVDGDGNVSMNLATQNASGAMSAADKAFLDSLSATMGDLTIVATDVNNNIIGVNGVDLMFVGTETSKTVYLTAYKDGKKVDITENSFPVVPFSRGGINDGVLTILATRAYALTVLNGSTPLTIIAGNASTLIYLTAKSDSQCYDILKGQVYVANNMMTGTLWTFDGAEPKVRYVRGGTYWVDLPQSWADVLGEFDETRLFVQVTMAGKNVAAHVYCGRYKAGEEYNGNTASTDCWGAILILTSNVENVAVDGSFYISVAYLPSVKEYEAENESDITYKLRVDDFHYETPLSGGEKNTIGYEGGTLVPRLTLMLDKYVEGVLDSSEEVEAESTIYSGSDEHEFDTSTGVMTWTRNVHGYAQHTDMFVDITAVSPNGELLTADAMVLDITQEASPTYIDIESFEYPTIPAEGGTFEPSAIGIYYYDTTTGAASGINGACTYKYSVSGSVATMKNEATGEMEVSANDTGSSRNIHVTMEVTYERDDITYWEKEAIVLSQASE